MKPKIVLFDLETSPNLGYVWGKYDQDVIRFQAEWDLLSFSYKPLGEKCVVIGQDTSTEEELVKELWKLFDENDILIAHNAYRFDILKSNVKFAQYNLGPPSPYKVIDTLRIAKRHFAFNSNKLDDLARFFGFKPKLQTGGFDTWLGCMNGEAKAWKKMLAYNKYDTELLERVYYKLRPWMANHPNLGDVSQADHVCPKCSSPRLEKRGFTQTRAGIKQRYQCKNCGGWSSEAKLHSKGRLVNA